MKRRTVQFILALILSVFNLPLMGQDLPLFKFSNYLQDIPKPLASCEETIRLFGNNSSADNEFNTALLQIQTQDEALLQLLFEQYKMNVQKIKSNKVSLFSFSTEERSLMDRINRSTGSLDDEGRFASFKWLMPERPLISSGKLSWGRLTGSSSAEAKQFYQRLVVLEKSINWILFQQEADARDPVKHMFQQNDAIRSLNEEFAQKREKIPVIKVKPFDGMDVTTDMQDPVKMIELIEVTEDKRKQILTRQYNELYSWWMQQMNRFNKFSVEFDRLLADASSFQTVDNSLSNALADVQERVCYTFTRLTSFSKKLIEDAQVIAEVDKQKASMIEMYKKMR